MQRGHGTKCSWAALDPGGAGAEATLPWAVTPVTELGGASKGFWSKLVFTDEETNTAHSLFLVPTCT